MKRFTTLAAALVLCGCARQPSDLDRHVGTLRLIGEQRVTANWSLVASFRGVAGDDFVATRLQAKAMLDHFDDAIFFAMALDRFNVWQNVVIFDEAAGVAGSRLMSGGFSKQRAEAAAKATVILIADMIAIDMRLG